MRGSIIGWVKLALGVDYADYGSFQRRLGMLRPQGGVFGVERELICCRGVDRCFGGENVRAAQVHLGEPMLTVQGA